MQRKGSIASLTGGSRLVDPLHPGPPPSPGGTRLSLLPSFSEFPTTALHNTPLSPRGLPRSNTYDEIRKVEKESKDKLDRAKRSLEEKLTGLERREYELVRDASRSKSEIQNLTQQLHRVKHDHAKLQSDYETVKVERATFLRDCNSYIEDLADEREKYEKLEKAARELQTKHEEMEKKAHDMEDLILKMTKIIDDIGRENKELRERDKANNHQIGKLNHENHDLRRQELSKERILDELRTENKDLKEQLADSSKNQAIDELNHNLSTERKRSQSLVHHLKDLEKHVKIQEQNLTSELEQNQYLVGEVKEFKQCLENEQKRSRSLVNEVEGLRQIMGSERTQKDQLVDEISKVNQSLSTEKTRNQKLIGEFNAFKQDVANEHQHLSNEIEHLSAENRKLAGELEEVKYTLAIERGRNQDLVNELNGIKRTLSTEQAVAQKLIKDVDQLERSLASERLRNRILTEEAAQIGDSNRNLTDDVKQLKAKLKSTEASRDSIRDCLADTEDRLNRSEQMQMLERTRRTQQTPPSSESGPTQTITLQPGSRINNGLLSPNTPTTQYDVYGSGNNSLYGRSVPLSPPQSPGVHINSGKVRDETRLQQENDKLRNDHNITKSDLARVESERKKLLEQNRILESDKAVCEQKLQESQTTLSEITGRCKTYEESSLKQRNLIESLTKDLEELDHNSNDGDAVMRQLEKTRTELRNANSDLEILREDLAVAMRERNEWAATCHELEEVNKENKKRLEELSEENRELSQQTSDLGSSVDTFTATENAALLMRIEKAALEIKSLHVAFENLQIENTDLATRLKDEAAAKEEISLKLEGLEASYQQSGNSKLESAGMLEKLAKVGFELSKLRQQFEALQVQNCQLASQLNEETVSKQSYQQKLQSLEGSYQALVNSSKDTEDVLEDKLQRCEQYINELEMERVILEEDLKKAEKAHSDLGRICTGYEDEAATATDKFNQADKDKTYWEDQYIALKEAHDELEEIYKTQTTKLASEGKQLGELAVENHNMGDELDFTRRKWEELKEKHHETEAALADSEQRMLSTIMELNQQSTKSRQEITRLNNEANQLRDNIERLKKDGRDLRSTIARLESAVDQRDSAIQIRDSVIARYVTSMAEKDREIHKEKTEVGRLNHEIENWDRRHQHARSEKLKVQAEYQLLKSKLDRQDGMITAVEKEKVKLERKLERHNEQLAEKDSALREARKTRDKTKERLEAYKEQRDSCAKLMRKLNDKVNYKKKDPVPYLFWLLNAKDAIEGKEARAWNCVVKKANGFKFRSYRVYA